MTAHTPGPWTAERQDEDSGDIYWAIHGAGYEFVANVYSANRDAVLIAAAPAMLIALRRAEAFITNGIELGFIRMPDKHINDPASETPSIIRAAIAKATGEP